MKNKFVMLDRDGVINFDPGYVHKIKDFKLLSGVVDALKLLKDFKFIIITNQSGIGRGYYSEKEFHKFNDKVVGELDKKGIRIEKTYYCWHSPEERCDCRKPNPKYMKHAEKEFNIDLKGSFMIGDHPCDIGLGKNGKCTTIYLLTGHGVRHLEEARKMNPDFIAKDLKQAALWIVGRPGDKVKTKEEIKVVVERLRNKKIVTCNGAFDILHPGHIKFLKEAKKQGEVLIVGVNSDSSVKQNKGPLRPLNNQKNRAKMLASLEFVDYVVIFDEKDPRNLISIIKPDVHVNGDEYGKDCIEAEVVRGHGGRIHLVKNYKGLSTTKIVDGFKKI